jgi:hypothetical protein
MQRVSCRIGCKKPAAVRSIEDEMPCRLFDATASSCGKIASKYMIPGEADVTGVGKR